MLELYGKRGALHGWAVSIKTQGDSAGGKGWYWYEVFSATDGNRTMAADRGVPACFECHAKGRDFVMSPSSEVTSMRHVEDRILQGQLNDIS